MINYCECVYRNNSNEYKNNIRQSSIIQFYRTKEATNPKENW